MRWDVVTRRQLIVRMCSPRKVNGRKGGRARKSSWLGLQIIAGCAGGVIWQPITRRCKVALGPLAAVTSQRVSESSSMSY